MATDTLEIVADKKFLDDAKEFFTAKGINLEDMILSYLSFRMNSEDTEFVELIELSEEEVSDDLKEAREEAQKTPVEERVSFKDNRHAYS